ncbi:unnamed protein product [Diatraea saccharalis]|uniref:Uncharacterized protein n=1 Tax=Diatraea saccharalis TaxID=40085 RepID=A0A9N9RDF5_9NEOP|nr:unnamed protein product [Diatraea saccharalis]
MNSHSFLSPRALMGAAIVGLVGAAGVFIYEQVYAEKRRAMLVSEVARLDSQVATLRTELEALRELQKEAQQLRLKQRKAKRVRAAVKPAGDTVDATEQSYASDSEYFTDYQSVLGTDHEMDSEEFYDVHTDEDDDDTLRDVVHNGRPAGTLDLDQDPTDAADVPKSPQNTT